MEEKGISFYEQALKKVYRPKTIELFEFIIKSKTEQKTILERLSVKVSKGDKILMDKSLDYFLNLRLENPFFELESMTYVTSPDIPIVDIFNHAIDIEARGLKMYSAFEKNEPDLQIKKVFRKLARLKRIHVQRVIDLGHFIFGITYNIEDMFA